jgi:hypothetical protein
VRAQLLRLQVQLQLLCAVFDFAGRLAATHTMVGLHAPGLHKEAAEKSRPAGEHWGQLHLGNAEVVQKLS